MKTTIKILMVLALAIVGYGANAQVDKTTAQSGSGNEVLKGSTYKYKANTADVNIKFEWIVKTASDGVVPAGDVVVVGGDTGTASITWKKEGSYKVILREYREYTPLTCDNVGENNFRVDVKVPNLSITNTNPNIVCASEVSAITFDIKPSGGVEQYTFDWEITDDASTKYSGSATTEGTGVDAKYTFDFNTTDATLKDFKVNRGSTVATYTLSITNVKDKYGVSLPNHSIDVVINRNPITSTITHD